MPDVTSCRHCGQEMDPGLDSCLSCGEPLARQVECQVCHEIVVSTEARRWIGDAATVVFLHPLCYSRLLDCLTCSRCGRPCCDPEMEPVPSGNIPCPHCSLPLGIDRCDLCGLGLMPDAPGVFIDQSGIYGAEPPEPFRPPMHHTICGEVAEEQLEKRRAPVKAARQTKGECLMCGKSLGLTDRLSKRLSHKDCHLFLESV